MTARRHTPTPEAEAVLSDPRFRRISEAVAARDINAAFALHDEIIGRHELARVRVEPGDVVIVKCRSEHESLSGLVTRLGPGVRAVLLPGACEIAVTGSDAGGAT